FATYTPDGNTLLTAGSDGQVLLWDLLSGKQLTITVSAEKQPVLSYAVSSDGKFLAIGREDRSIIVWDIISNSRRDHLESAAKPTALSFHPTSSELLCEGGEDGTIRLTEWAKRTVKTTMKGHDGPVTCLAWSARGRMLASGGADRSARAW